MGFTSCEVNPASDKAFTPFLACKNVKVPLEEIGHGIEAQLNEVEIVGDEGAIFAQLVQGKTISDAELAVLQAEDDQRNIKVNNEVIGVEMANFIGDGGNNNLTGTNENDLIQGLGGNDNLFGREGNDTIEGGTGNDNLRGEEGDDYLDGGEGNDYFVENAAADTIIGGAGSDRLDLYAGETGLTVDYSDFNNGTTSAGGSIKEIEDFRFRGGVGDDNVTATAASYFDVRGGEGNDTFVGGVGNDYIEGDGGNDSIVGNAGNDNLRGEEGDDYLDGGEGNDFFSEVRLVCA